MVRKLRFAVCVALLFLVQTTLVHRFSFRFLRPDLLCATAVFLALEADFQGALWGAFALGLLRDMGSAGRPGASALFLVAASGGLAFLRDHLLRDSFLTDLALTLTYMLAFGLAMAVATAAWTPGPHVVGLVQDALGQAAYTTAVSPLLFALLAKVGIVDRSAPFLTDVP
jgi:rod shape-determining protein MreD